MKHGFQPTLDVPGFQSPHSITFSISRSFRPRELSALFNCLAPFVWLIAGRRLRRAATASHRVKYSVRGFFLLLLVLGWGEVEAVKTTKVFFFVFFYIQSSSWGVKELGSTM